MLPSLRKPVRSIRFINPITKWGEHEMTYITPIDAAEAQQLICFPHFSAADLPAIFFRHTTFGARRKLASRQMLWSEGDSRGHVYLIRSGSVCFSQMLPDGRRVVIGFAYPGDLIGLGASRHPCSAESMQTCLLEAMTIAAFQRAVSVDPELARLAQNEVSEALVSAYQHVVVISKLTATERLAHFLVDLLERNERRGNGKASIVLPMRRIDIADFLGLTIETVSRIFTAFKCAGLIAMDQPSIVFLRDLPRLAALAHGDRDAAPEISSPGLAA
jgi:CRP/FNR family transcriptional regulator, anaerobic regulatory protein